MPNEQSPSNKLCLRCDNYECKLSENFRLRRTIRIDRKVVLALVGGLPRYIPTPRFRGSWITHSLPWPLHGATRYRVFGAWRNNACDKTDIPVQYIDDYLNFSRLLLCLRRACGGNVPENLDFVWNRCDWPTWYSSVRRCLLVWNTRCFIISC